MFRKFCIAIGFILVIAGVYGLSIDQVPTPANYANDYSGTLNVGQINQLNSQLKSISDDSNIQIGVWLIDSTDGKPISDYALELGNKFGVGNTGRYDGIVILVAIKDRDYFISTAKGAETMLTDIQVRDIEIRDFDPNFKAGDFYTGLNLAISDLNSTVSTSDLPAKPTNIGGLGTGIIFPALIVVIILILVFTATGFNNGEKDNDIVESKSKDRKRKSSDDDFIEGAVDGAVIGSTFRSHDDDESSSSGGSNFGGGFGGFGGSGGFSGGGSGGSF
jgi:uncharacterized protein